MLPFTLVKSYPPPICSCKPGGTFSRGSSDRARVTDQAVSFLKEFATKPQEIGAIVPSSQALARSLVESIDWNDVRVVAEYGPGLGAITAEILGHAFDKDFFVVGLNQTYADAFSRRFPAVLLHRDSAANAVEIARARCSRIDCVVSVSRTSTRMGILRLQSLRHRLFPQGSQRDRLYRRIRGFSDKPSVCTFSFRPEDQYAAGTRASTVCHPSPSVNVKASRSLTWIETACRAPCGWRLGSAVRLSR
ncbi:MAG: hypothetical protein BMS9Abin37_2916 [Acidobacteriota bacterium]|nr:MAG: hypothetical protein BMS9Abin37_2916 [Acidobacteriota bacterium]